MEIFLSKLSIRAIMKLIDLQDYILGNSYQYFEMIVYAAVGFFIPFFIGHPQIAVGIIVNAMLIVSALNLKGWKIAPIIILPSLAMLSRGLLFGQFTIFLLYMIPFIWIGNFILVLSFKYLKLRRKNNYWVTLVLGSLFKSGFLFLSAFLLYSLGLIPVIFLTAMGIMQLITALIGGVAGYGVHNLKKILA